MIKKEYDPVIYPFKLVIVSNVEYDYITESYQNLSADGWGEKEEYEKKAATVNEVLDLKDDQIKILLTFSSKNNLTMKYICHESFHVAIEYCKLCNMSIGFEIGQDEHPAYIAGWVGDCVSDFISILDNHEVS